MSVNRNSIRPGAIIYADHEGKERPHFVLKVTDASKDVFLIQTAVMSSKKPLQLDGNYKLAKGSNIHLYRLVELKLDDVNSVKKKMLSEQEYDDVVRSLSDYIDQSYHYAM